jgi:Thioredoxin like C-terminal domain/AhpC/TSA family
MTDMPGPLQLPVEGELPSLSGATGWLNSEALSAASLVGRPVLVQFWTFTCINWIRTVPYVRSWFTNYRGDGLAVLGVHTPEFEVERDVGHIRCAAQEMGIEYPIAVDSDYRIWRAFGNNYWPALYFADARGQIRHHRFGEGDYEYSQTVIRLLLSDAGAQLLDREAVAVVAHGIEAAADWEHLQSPESYVGYLRAEHFASPGGAARDQPQEYALPDVLRMNQWALTGDWTVGQQAAVLNAPGGAIAHRFHARDLNLVMGPATDGRPVRFRVLLGGQPPGRARGVDADEQGEGTITQPRLYQLIRQPAPVTDHTFQITFSDPGAHAYVFTFG